MRKLLAVAMLVVVLGGCGRSTANHVKDDDKVRIAVFEYQMETYQAPVFFLSVGEAAGDPNAAIMEYFRDHDPPVKPASECAAAGADSINDVSTGETGIIIKAAAIHWISEKEADVTGGYFAGAKAASGNTYHVVLKNGEWVVDKDTADWATNE